jgi:hypothetical protein
MKDEKTKMKKTNTRNLGDFRRKGTLISLIAQVFLSALSSFLVEKQDFKPK